MRLEVGVHHTSTGGPASSGSFSYVLLSHQCSLARRLTSRSSRHFLSEATVLDQHVQFISLQTEEGRLAR
jgi:hypothetical protein